MSNLREFAADPLHLIVRFFGSLSPHPPSIDAERFADDHLLPGERNLWIQMSNQDRRHSAAVAMRFAESRTKSTRDEIAGALLHDVGKLECELGTFSRTVATVVGPRTKRYRAYHDHEELGARLAERAGSTQATVELIAERGPAFDDLTRCDF